MMKLRETAAVAASALPRDELVQQLRLPGGFPSDAGLDGKLISCLRAALSTVEARTSKALFRRSFVWRLGAWTGVHGQALPVAPVHSVDAITLTLRDGTQTVQDPLDFRVADDTHKPILTPRSGVLPAIQQGGHAEIILTAGYGLQWDEVPGDLREAVLILAADYFDMPQSRDAGMPGMPAAAQALIEPYRNLSLRGLR